MSGTKMFPRVIIFGTGLQMGGGRALHSGFLLLFLFRTPSIILLF